MPAEETYTSTFTHDEIIERYSDRMKMCERMPEMMVPQMGNHMYTVLLNDQKETDDFIKFVHDKA